MSSLLVGVFSDLIVHHHTVNQTLSQQARVLLPQLQRAQPAQVLALKRKTQTPVSVSRRVSLLNDVDPHAAECTQTWK